MTNVPAHLPGDLGEHDPRREAHPIGNEPGSGGHEVKIGSNEAKGLNSDATAAEHSHTRNPGSDNTAEQAFNGGSVENMDRQKRQQASDIPGGRTGHDGVSDHLTRAGLEQQGNNREYNNSGLTGNHGSGLTGSSHTGSHTGTGLVAEGERALHSGSHSHQHGSTGSGLTGSTGYGSDNLQSSGFSGSDPQERHQLHHGTAHHAHDFSHSHNTRTGELLDPASGRDTGIPGYAGGASGLTGSSHTGTGLTGSSHTGTGLTGSNTGYGQTGTGLTGSSHTGSTGSGLVAEGERALHSGSHGTHGQTGYGQTGTGLTGSNTGYDQTGSGLTGSSHTGTGLTGSNTGYGQTGTGLTGSSHTGSTGSGLVAEGERALHGNHGQTGYGQTGSGLTGSHTGTGLTGSNTGSGLTGSNTGYGQTGTTTGSGLTGSHTGSTGERLREDVREGEHATSHTGATEHKKPSLLDKLNPMKDSDGDGKKGFMKLFQLSTLQDLEMPSIQDSINQIKDQIRDHDYARQSHEQTQREHERILDEYDRMTRHRSTRMREERDTTIRHGNTPMNTMTPTSKDMPLIPSLAHAPLDIWTRPYQLRLSQSPMLRSP
ncbi:hypothetical protein E4T45_10419 [Aureobasidium sp. EXF-8846]|nr:hypothetical protein E4T45_10419 [Aureobasidium sp. EXF-8846]